MSNLTIIDQRIVLGKEFKVYGGFDDLLFLAKDVAGWIEHSNPTEMVRGIDDSEKLNSTILSAGQNREVTFVTEDGLMEILFQSRKPIAKDFKKQVKLILKEIRKTGYYQPAPMTQMQMIAAMAQAAAEQEQQIKALAEAQTAQATELQGIRDVVTLCTTSWRKDTSRLIVKIAQKQGGTDYIQSVRKESYIQLNRRIGVDIDRRLINKRQRMARDGATQSMQDKANYLDVIGEDKKLLETYIAIIKEMSIRAGVSHG